jgi:hypothetical protein
MKIKIIHILLFVILFSPSLTHADTHWALNGVNLYNTNGGFVGIGTTTPQANLAVVGGNVIFQVHDTNTFGGTIRVGSIDGLSGQWSYDGSANTYFDFAQIFRLRSITGGTSDRFTVTSAGNVGIGTTTPTEKLHVSGNIKLTGNITSDGDICIGYCQ